MTRSGSSTGQLLILLSRTKCFVIFPLRCLRDPAHARGRGGQKEHESNFSRARPSQDMFEHGSRVLDKSRQEEKADSTLRSSQAVPHPSTDRALRRLTSEVERDPVHSTWYGRQRIYFHDSDSRRNPVDIHLGSNLEPNWNLLGVRAGLGFRV